MFNSDQPLLDLNNGFHHRGYYLFREAINLPTGKRGKLRALILTKVF